MFERSKIINGLEYIYIVRNERVGKTVRQKVVKYLGPVEPIYKKIKRETRKSNAWLFAREITEAEKEELKKALNSQAFTRDRARIILFSIEGEKCHEISKMMKCDERKVRNAIKSFNKKGLPCIKRGKAKGAEPRFTKEQRVEILRVANTDPRNLDLFFTTWSLHKLQEYLIKNNIVDYINHESIRIILRQQGFRIRKSKKFQYSNDPDFLKKS